MPDPQRSTGKPAALPPGFHDLAIERRVESPGHALWLARCRFDAGSMRDDAFSRCGIEPPASIRGAVAKRRAEYLAGRLCAREALRVGLGRRAVPGRNASGAPHWPAGAVGSITHADGQAMALVGSAESWQSIGLDHEPWLSPAIAGEIVDEVLSPAERPGAPENDPAALAAHVTRVFCAKETLYKALYPQVGVAFYFHDAERTAAGHLRLRIDLSPRWRAGSVFELQAQEDDHGVTCWIALPRTDRD